MNEARMNQETTDFFLIGCIHVGEWVGDLLADWKAALV